MRRSWLCTTPSRWMVWPSNLTDNTTEQPSYGWPRDWELSKEGEKPVWAGRWMFSKFWWWCSHNWDWLLTVLQGKLCGQGGPRNCLDDSGARWPWSFWRGFRKHAQALELRGSTSGVWFYEPWPRRVWNPHEASLGGCKGFTRRHLRDGHRSLFHPNAPRSDRINGSPTCFSLALQVQRAGWRPPPTPPCSSLWVADWQICITPEKFAQIYLTTRFFWHILDLHHQAFFFRDGAGCFGNNDGVPPAEVKEIIIMIMTWKYNKPKVTIAQMCSGISQPNVQFQLLAEKPFNKTITKHFAGSFLGWNPKSTLNIQYWSCLSWNPLACTINVATGEIEASLIEVLNKFCLSIFHSKSQENIIRCIFPSSLWGIRVRCQKHLGTEQLNTIDTN